MPPDGAVEFMRSDWRRWIFPLESPVTFAASGCAELRRHIGRIVLDDDHPDGFLAGHIAFARKDEYHLRRTLVLDPISTFFIFDFAWTHRKSFQRRRDSPARQQFGPAFAGSKPVRAFDDYHTFRRRKYALIRDNDAFCQADIFNCFNSFYHHDVVNFMSGLVDEETGRRLGQFLRELNAGDSVACFPQGYYPAKVIGNRYLSFIETTRTLRPNSILRYLDDVVMGAANEQEARDNLLQLQQIIDQRHLALNDAKTLVGDDSTHQSEARLDQIKRRLVKLREKVTSDYSDETDEDGSGPPLSLKDEERDYLMALVKAQDVAQEDVELALSLLQEGSDALELLLDLVVERAPHLLRELHRFLAPFPDADGAIWTSVSDRLDSGRTLAEFDLFWLARIVIDYYEYDQVSADLLFKIHEHPDATAVVRAAILETTYLEHGLVDLKHGAIRNSSSLLEAAAAMVGVRDLGKSGRNQAYKYAKRNGPNFAVLADIARTFRPTESD